MPSTKRSELWRQRAAVLLARTPNRKRAATTNGKDAEHYLLRALEIAKAQGAGLFALRISIDLCRLWQEGGRVEEARRHLAEVVAAYPQESRGEAPLPATDLLSQLTGGAGI